MIMGQRSGYTAGYRDYLKRHDGVRPKNPNSLQTAQHPQYQKTKTVCSDGV